MTDVTHGLVEVIRAAGPTGFLVAASIVGLSLVVLILLKTADLFSAARTSTQNAAFQERLLKDIDARRALEESLRSEVAELRAANATLKEQMASLEAQLDLARTQLATVTELLRKATDQEPESLHDV